MVTSARILIGTIVAFVVVVVGFGVGMQMRKDREAAPAVQTAAEETIPVNNNTYEISPPSNGVLLETYAINIVPEGYIAYVRIPAHDADDIKTGQRLFLYDQKGELLDTMGDVLSVGQPDGDNLALLQINLKNNPDISPSLIGSGKIIIDRLKNTERLPFSALLRNKNGETFLWEVTQGADGAHTAKRVPVKLLAENDLMFSLETNPGHSNTFILNPDAQLRDNQKVNIRQNFYRPPSQYEDQRIEAIVNQRINNLAAATTAADTIAANPAKCAQPASATQDFINKVKALSEAPATP